MSARDIATRAFADALRAGLDVSEAEQVARTAFEYARNRRTMNRARKGF